MSRSARALVLGCGFVLFFISPVAANPAQSDQTSAASIVPLPELQSPAEALHSAVRSGNLDEVKYLVSTGTDVNARDLLGSTPLLDASWAGDSAITGFLLIHGADVNARQRETGSTALEYAVLAGRTDVIKLLLDAGARVDLRYGDNRTILHIAAARPDAHIVELLLDAHADLTAEDSNGSTALDQAALHGQAAVAGELIAHGAAVGRVHLLDGRGPLHEACIKGFANLVQPFVDAGADPVQPDRSGQTPIDLALAYKNAAVVAALLRLGPRTQHAAEQAMESATLRGQTEVARTLIESGFDVAKPTPEGSTYLHDAALKGQKKMVQLFLAKGVGVNALNRDGATALHDAALGGNAEVIAMLLDRGARIDALDRQTGATPLMLAAALGRTSAVALLLRRGANPTLKDYAGHTALDRARETEQEDTIKLLETALARSIRPDKTGG